MPRTSRSALDARESPSCPVPSALCLSFTPELSGGEWTRSFQGELFVDGDARVLTLHGVGFRPEEPPPAEPPPIEPAPVEPAPVESAPTDAQATTQEPPPVPPPDELVNQAPIARDDTRQVMLDDFVLLDLLNNDEDPDGDPF